MKKLLLLSLIIFASLNVFAQNNLQKIYDTEKAFEKSVAEKGINTAFTEYSTADGICFFPGFPVNCIEFFKTRKESKAALFWNPTFIDVSSNGALAYSTGNSVYKPNGKDEPLAYYGEYVTIWQRQPDGNYKSALDLGILHADPNRETKWTSPPDSGKALNENKYSAADTSTAFFEMAAKQGISKAYKNYFADDVRLLREGKMPIVGRENALGEYRDGSVKINFAKRSVFVGAADMAYIANSYTMVDKSGKPLEKGNFMQVWKFRNNKWQIVLDVFLSVPLDTK